MDAQFVLQDMEVFEKFVVLLGNTRNLTPAAVVLQDVNKSHQETVVSKC